MSFLIQPLLTRTAGSELNRLGFRSTSTWLPLTEAQDHVWASSKTHLETARAPTRTNGLVSLAYAEIYLTIARLVTSFDMDLFETTTEDVEFFHIRLTGYPKKGNGEVKVMIRKYAE